MTVPAFGRDDVARGEARIAMTPHDPQHVSEPAATAQPHTGPPDSVLDAVPRHGSALSRADALARKAAGVGFTWSRPDDVLSKLDEELAELREALRSGQASAIADEFGDVLFTLANLGRFVGADAEAALAAANAKFARRFRAVEAALARDGRSPETSDLAEMDRLWSEAKAAERG